MSFRELRNFTEIMRTLGYPRLISLENFRTPNFQLVAELLIWLIARIDQTANLHYDINVEEERVHLIRSTAQILALKAGVKVNTRKLYQADGHAVQELLKVASLLYSSIKADKTADEADFTIESHVGNIALVETRQLLSDITSKGATLYDLLVKEPELREMRHSKAARPVEVTQVEGAVKIAIKETQEEAKKTQRLIDGVDTNEAALLGKIDKIKSDIDRQGKRLQSLKKMRPAYIEEFEKLENDLKTLYGEYVCKCKNLSYLEGVLDQMDKADRIQWESKHESTRNILEDLKQDVGEIVENQPKTATGALKGKPRASAAKGPRKTFGSMMGSIEESDDDSLDDSDDDLLLDGDITEEDDKSFKDSEDDF